MSDPTIDAIRHLTADLLGLADVHRWTVISTARNQSVAEHSYAVAVIVIELTAVLGIDMLIAHDAIKWALAHDLPETLTGDIDGKFKRDNPRVKMEVALAELDAFPTYARIAHAASPQVNALVKLADKVEAIMFIRKWGVGVRARQVGDELHSAVLPEFVDRVAVGFNCNRDLVYRTVEGMLYRYKFDTHTIQARTMKRSGSESGGTGA